MQLSLNSATFIYLFGYMDPGSTQIPSLIIIMLLLNSCISKSKVIKRKKEDSRDTIILRSRITVISSMPDPLAS